MRSDFGNALRCDFLATSRNNGTISDLPITYDSYVWLID